MRKFPIPSDPRDYFCGFRSTLLRNDERISFMFRKSVHGQYLVSHHRNSYVRSPYFQMSVGLESIDRLLLRAENIPALRDILARIIEVLICPVITSRASIRWNLLNLNCFGVLGDALQEAETLISNLIAHALSAAESLESASISFIESAVLSIVYQCLIGYVDRGGTKTYNSGSLEFRATYVSLLLFQGAYVWIKFRDVAPKRTVYRRCRKDENGGFQYYGKYEPRFKPPREKDVVTGTTLKLHYLPLGGYDTRQDAEVVCQIAGFYYGKDGGMVELEDGVQFSIPGMSEEERGLRGEEKRKWVSVKAKEVYKELKKEEAARRQPRTLSANVGEPMDACDNPLPADQAVEFSTATGNLSDDEFVNFLLELAQDNDRSVSFNPEIPLNVDDVLDDIQEGCEAMPDCLNEQLNLQKEQLEAEFNRRIAELHQQHLEKQHHLEEQNLELRRENEHMKSILHKEFSLEAVEATFDALAALHDCGLLNGDIRCPNFLVDNRAHQGVRLMI